MMNHKLILLLFIHLILGILIGHFIIREKVLYMSNYLLSTPPRKDLADVSFHLSSHVQIINLNKTVNATFQCIKSKTLLNYISTNICLYPNELDRLISASFRKNISIWEESEVTRILELLIRNPHLDFIDVGANIGIYTMYAAALGRFVLAIDCFAPNLDRIHRAIQLQNVANRVVLIQNAIFNRSGQFLRLRYDVGNIGGQELDVSKTLTNNQSVINNPYIVKTIKFDDLVPILMARGIRGAIIKMDIEGSESFAIESGSQIFDSFEIPFVQMEWHKVRHYPDRVKVIVKFFTRRNYDPKTLSCGSLNLIEYPIWPGDICWIKRNVSTFC